MRTAGGPAIFLLGTCNRFAQPDTIDPLHIRKAQQ